MTYEQVPNTGNEEYRDAWVKSMLEHYRGDDADAQLRLLDVGAGRSPYRQTAIELGCHYRSQDFAQYVPSGDSPGLQDASWDYPQHTFVCDITEIPLEATSDVILCTEVLEHVPDSVRAFERMAQLLTPGGRMIVSVPLMSLMHQAPYWFQAGLSPFWFEHWAEQNGLDIEVLSVYGDYADLMTQEAGRLLGYAPRIKGLHRLGVAGVKRLRSRLPKAYSTRVDSAPCSSAARGRSRRRLARPRKNTAFRLGCPRASQKKRS